MVIVMWCASEYKRTYFEEGQPAHYGGMSYSLLLNIAGTNIEMTELLADKTEGHYSSQV